MMRITRNIAFSLILPASAGSEGFCLLNSYMRAVYQQKNPLKYYIPPYSGWSCLKFMNYMG